MMHLGNIYSAHDLRFIKGVVRCAAPNSLISCNVNKGLDELAAGNTECAIRYFNLGQCAVSNHGPFIVWFTTEDCVFTLQVSSVYLRFHSEAFQLHNPQVVQSILNFLYNQHKHDLVKQFASLVIDVLAFASARKGV